MSIDMDRFENSGERHLHTGLDFLLASMKVNASNIDSDAIEKHIQDYAQILRMHCELIKLMGKINDKGEI